MVLAPGREAEAVEVGDILIGSVVLAALEEPIAMIVRHHTIAKIRRPPLLTMQEEAGCLDSGRDSDLEG